VKNVFERRKKNYQFHKNDKQSQTQLHAGTMEGGTVPGGTFLGHFTGEANGAEVGLGSDAGMFYLLRGVWVPCFRGFGGGDSPGVAKRTGYGNTSSTTNVKRVSGKHPFNTRRKVGKVGKEEVVGNG